MKKIPSPKRPGAAPAAPVKPTAKAPPPPPAKAPVKAPPPPPAKAAAKAPPPPPAKAAPAKAPVKTASAPAKAAPPSAKAAPAKAAPPSAKAAPAKAAPAKATTPVKIASNKSPVKTAPSTVKKSNGIQINIESRQQQLKGIVVGGRTTREGFVNVFHDKFAKKAAEIVATNGSVNISKAFSSMIVGLVEEVFVETTSVSNFMWAGAMVKNRMIKARLFDSPLPQNRGQWSLVPVHARVKMDSPVGGQAEFKKTVLKGILDGEVFTPGRFVEGEFEPGQYDFDQPIVDEKGKVVDYVFIEGEESLDVSEILSGNQQVQQITDNGAEEEVAEEEVEEEAVEEEEAAEGEEEEYAEEEDAEEEEESADEE
jgi:hypothetical protein